MAEPPLNDITLYTRNDVTVDSGGGVDIRRLDDVNGATSASQTCNAAHTADNQERTFDPATTGFVSNLDARNLQKLGWAVPTSDFTPSEGVALLAAQTVTVSMRVAVSWGGTPLTTPVSGAVFRASLWKYDPTTDAGTLIASGASSSQTWTAGQSGATRTVTVPITVAADETFAASETLLLQIGVNVGTLGNPAAGTITYVFTLLCDADLNNITFGTHGLRRQLSSALSGAIAPSAALAKKTHATYEGATSPAGVLGKRVHVMYEGAIAPSAALAKKTHATHEGAVTPSGALTKEPQIALEGTITPSSDLSAFVRKALSGSLTPSGDLSFLARVLLEGVVAPAGALAKKASTTYEGAIAPGGVLDTAFIAVRSFAGTITPSGAVIRKAVAKRLTGTIAPAGALTSRLFKALAGVIVPVGALSKKVSKFFDAELGPPSGGVEIVEVIRQALVLDGSVSRLEAATVDREATADVGAVSAIADIDRERSGTSGEPIVGEEL
jgi:hypothetical protein